MALGGVQGTESGAVRVPETSSLEVLEALPGVGAWTRSMVAMRALGDPDAFPLEDLALRRVLVNEAGEAFTTRQLGQLAEGWRPWRAYAAMHLWAMDSERQSGRLEDVRAVAP